MSKAGTLAFLSIINISVEEVGAQYILPFGAKTDPPHFDVPVRVNE